MEAPHRAPPACPTTPCQPTVPEPAFAEGWSRERATRRVRLPGWQAARRPQHRRSHPPESR
eukprot:2608185-Alexandrium_andersonii.AAC.1